MLRREYRYNYQSWCSRETYQVQTMSASTCTSIIAVIYQTVMSLSWNFFYSTLLYVLSSYSTWSHVEGVDLGPDPGNHSCVTRSAWYYHTGVTALSGNFECDDQQRNFSASYLSNVTLILVIAQPPLDCFPPTHVLSLDPEEGKVAVTVTAASNFRKGFYRAI